MAAILSPRPHHLQLPSPIPRAASSSSVRSAATSADDLTEVIRIDKQRAPYDRRLSDMVSCVKLDGPTPATNGTGTKGHKSQSSQSSLSAASGNGCEPATDKKLGSSDTLAAPVRRFPEEEDEDILRETEDRFVLFPIKYREVSCHRRIGS